MQNEINFKQEMMWKFRKSIKEEEFELILKYGKCRDVYKEVIYI